MSVQAMAWVFDHSSSTLGARLVLLAIANHADKEGANSWASVHQLAEEARLSERKVQYALRSLTKAGEIRIVGRSKARTNIYELPSVGAQSAPREPDGVQPTTAKGALHDSQRVNSSAPEPSTEPSLNQDLASSGRARNRDELFEAVMEVSGVDLAEIPDEARGSYNAAVAGLRKVGATPQEVRRRAPQAWFTVTPGALLRHWAELRGGSRRPKPQLTEPCSDCGGREAHREWCPHERALRRAEPEPDPPMVEAEMP